MRIFSFRFVAGLLFIIILVQITLFIYGLYYNTQKYKTITNVALLLFSSLCIITRFVSIFTNRTGRNQMFISYAMVSALVKMISSIVILLLYEHFCKPKDGTFIIPFLIVYVLFTIFETSDMLKLSQMTSKTLKR